MRIYFVRHAESPYTEGTERARGLSEAGKRDADRVRSVLEPEGIDVLISSPYARSVDTLRPLATLRKMEIRLEEDLRERTIGDFGSLTFKEAKRLALTDLSFSFPGGESGVSAQKRAVAVIRCITEIYRGQKVAIGTHGDIMTLMLQHFDPRYGFDFWVSTSMPDIYKAVIVEGKAVQIERMWEPGKRE